jgi:TonB family protein
MTGLEFLVQTMVKASALLAVAFAVNYALRRGSAALRHFVWTAAFAVLLALPLVMAIGPRWAAAAPTAPGAGSRRSGVEGPAAVTMVVRGVRPATGRRIPFEWLYFAGALVVVGRFGIGIWRTRKMVRGAGVAGHAVKLVEELRCALRIRRPVRALQSVEATVPMTWGILRPVALLPEAAREWPAARLHAVVLHELVHVQRHDLLAQTLAQAACCLYWFHPLVWLAARELRKERERACDDAVLNRGVGAADYAGHLMEMVRSMAARQVSLADAPAMAEASDLESRVRALLDRGRNRTPLSRWMAMTVAALACVLVLPVATLTTHAQAGRGALAGIVTDPSGARVPGCAITIKNLDGSDQEGTKANGAGEYGFASIPAGRYTIEVSARGFKMSQQEGVVMAGMASRADVALAIGNVSEVVTIRATRPSTAPSPSAARPMGTQERIPIGGNVQMARLIRQPKAVYPEELKQQGISGVVMIQAVISKTGELINPKVINTDVNLLLAQAALDAVQQWRYQPTLLNGEPVEVATKIDVAFELDQ